MEIREKKLRGITALVLNGRFDSSASREFETCVTRVIAAGISVVVVDFSGVEYISSAGLRVLLYAAKTLKPSGRKILLCGVQENVMMIFDISGLKSLFEFYETEDAAIAVS